MSEKKTIELRLIELESKVAFQDHMIDALNEVITSQQQQIDRIEIELGTAHNKLKALLLDSGGSDGV